MRINDIHTHDFSSLVLRYTTQHSVVLFSTNKIWGDGYDTRDFFSSRAKGVLVICFTYNGVFGIPQGREDFDFPWNYNIAFKRLTIRDRR